MQALILIEQPHERRRLWEGLPQMGIAVQTAADWPSWTAYPSALPLDLVVLGLPVSQSQHVVAEIRRCTVAPLLVITDVSTEAERRVLYAAGADLVVVRPYSFRLLLLQAGSIAHRALRLAWA